jgi:hypothetical protein
VPGGDHRSGRERPQRNLLPWVLRGTATPYEMADSRNAVMNLSIRARAGHGKLKQPICRTVLSFGTADRRITWTLCGTIPENCVAHHGFLQGDTKRWPDGKVGLTPSIEVILTRGTSGRIWAGGPFLPPDPSGSSLALRMTSHADRLPCNRARASCTNHRVPDVPPEPAPARIVLGSFRGLPPGLPGLGRGESEGRLLLCPPASG